MSTSPLMSIYDHRTQASYEVRVRGTTAPFKYLWGSAGITDAAKFDKPLLLHVRNDQFGEQITLWQVISGTPTTLGTLAAGECVTIPLQNVSSGVYATCEFESKVACLVKGTS
jgi:hypothetical protein